MTIPLSQEIVSEIQTLGKGGRTAWETGNISLAEQKFLAIWDIIPEPKFEHDYAQSISRGLVSFYRDTGQLDKALEWIEIYRNAYGAWNPSVEFDVATVYFAFDNYDKAFKIFDEIYKKYGNMFFSANDKKYSEFYLDRLMKAKR